MNVELKRRIDPFPTPAVAPANDNTHRGVQLLPPRRCAVIYKPAKSAMTSGRAATKRWLLEFEPQSAPFIEPLMGWTGSADPLAHVRLAFPTCEAAVAYARRQCLDHEVRGAPKPVKTCAPFDQREHQLIDASTTELLADRNNLLLTQKGVEGIVSSLAA